MAIAACFVFQREISRSVFWDLPMHFCEFSTTSSKAPLIIKLTSAFITGDRKPKQEDVSVGYTVEAFAVTGAAAHDIKEVNLQSGRIVSDVFHTDVHAVKSNDGGSAATYLIPSEGSLALFTSVITRCAGPRPGNNKTITLDIRPTPEIFDPSQKWLECSVDIMKAR